MVVGTGGEGQLPPQYFANQKFKGLKKQQQIYQYGRLKPRGYWKSNIYKYTKLYCFAMKN